MTTLDREQPRATDGARHPGAVARPLPLRLAVPAAVSAGLALLVAFPPYGLWPLAPVGVALLAAAVHRRRLRAGAGLGFLAGVALFAPLLEWTNLHTGWLPWALLSLLQAGYLALLGAATAWVSPLADRWRVGWPLLTGVLWVGQEALRDRTPFGGSRGGGWRSARTRRRCCGWPRSAARRLSRSPWHSPVGCCSPWRGGTGAAGRGSGGRSPG